MSKRLGNPIEFTIKELAELVCDLAKSDSSMEYKELPSDDPMQRQPDISTAIATLEWEPTVQLKEGLELSIPYFKELLLAEL